MNMSHSFAAPTRLESRIAPEVRHIGSHRQFRFLQAIVVAVLILNLLDGVLTLFWIQFGQATEANPVMETLAHQYPIVFMGAKTALVGAGLLILWQLRKRSTSVVAIFLIFWAYYAVLLYHLHSMNLRLVTRWFE